MGLQSKPVMKLNNSINISQYRITIYKRYIAYALSRQIGHTESMSHITNNNQDASSIDFHYSAHKA